MKHRFSTIIEGIQAHAHLNCSLKLYRLIWWIYSKMFCPRNKFSTLESMQKLVRTINYLINVYSTHTSILPSCLLVALFVIFMPVVVYQADWVQNWTNWRQNICVRRQKFVMHTTATWSRWTMLTYTSDSTRVWFCRRCWIHSNTFKKISSVCGPSVFIVIWWATLKKTAAEQSVHGVLSCVTFKQKWLC